MNAKYRRIEYFILFSFTLMFYVLLHPQQAANFLAFLGTILFIYSLGTSRIQSRVNRRVLSVSFLILGIMFWIWVRHLPHFEISISRIVINLFVETTAAKSVKTRSVSVEGVGGSIPEVAFKLFFVSFIYCLIAGLLMICLFLLNSRWNDRIEKYLVVEEKTILFYYTIGFFPVLFLFFVYIVQGISDQYFRHLGFLMVIVTILGSIFLGNLFHRKNNYIWRISWCFILLLFLSLSVPIVFSSPYFYQNTNHVTEGEITGYHTLFEIHDKSSMITPRRGNTERIEDAIYGEELRGRPDFKWSRPEQGLPDHFANQSLPTYYDSPVYGVIKSDAEELEIGVWNEFRYNKSDFQYLNKDRNIAKVQANGHIDVYYITPADDT